MPYRQQTSLSFPYQSRIVLLLFSYRSPIVLLLGKRKRYGNNTESNGGWTNEERWNKGGLSYFYRNFLWQWQDSNKLLWVYATKWFSNNTSDNVRHSAVKYLYAEGSCRVLWGSSSKRNVPKSTFINPREIINIETVSQSNQQFRRYIFRIILRSFSVWLSFGSRSALVRLSFVLRSVLVRFSFDSQSVLDRFSFILRSFSVRRSKIDRRMIEEISENHRRQDGDVSKL